MSRTSALSALALLVLIVAALGAVAAGTPGDAEHALADGEPTVRSLSNTSNYLVLEEPSQQSYLHSGIDVGTSVRASARQLHARHENLTFDRRFEAREQSSARLSLARDAADAVGTRLDRLDARQSRLFADYANGTVSERAFLRRLTALSVRTQAADGYLEHVRARVDSSLETRLPVGLDTRISSLQTRLIVLPKPVLERVRASAAGRSEQFVVYTEGTGAGLVLATADNGEFLRQATLQTEYAPDQVDRFDQSEEQRIFVAFQRGNDLYPWVYANAINGPRFRGFGDTSVYRITADHPQGSLRTYLSGGTRNAFHEIQRQRPDTVPVTATRSGESGPLSLSVGTTSETGPMRVQLTDGSDTPVDGSVRIDGEFVGRTGSDGRLWTVRPSGRARVNATVGGNSVAVTVS